MRIVLNDYNIKEIIKMLRESTDLTQKEFAKSVFYSKDAIKKMESGQRNIYLHTFLAWTKIHNIQIVMESKKEP